MMNHEPEITIALRDLQQYYTSAPLSFLSERDVQGHLFSSLIRLLPKTSSHPIEKENDSSYFRFGRAEISDAELKEARHSRVFGSQVHMEVLSVGSAQSFMGRPDIYITDAGSPEVYIVKNEKSGSIEYSSVSYPDAADITGIELKMYLHAPNNWITNKKRRDDFIHDFKKLAICRAGWFVLATCNAAFANYGDWNKFIHELKDELGIPSTGVSACYLSPSIQDGPWIAS